MIAPAEISMCVFPLLIHDRIGVERFDCPGCLRKEKGALEHAYTLPYDETVKKDAAVSRLCTMCIRRGIKKGDFGNGL